MFPKLKLNLESHVFAYFEIVPCFHEEQLCFSLIQPHSGQFVIWLEHILDKMILLYCVLELVLFERNICNLEKKWSTLATSNLPENLGFGFCNNISIDLEA